MSIRADLFYWDNQNNYAMADHSTIELHKHLRQVYPDAIDLGFDIFNPKTGNTITVVHYVDDLGDEGELTGSWYRVIRFNDSSKIPNHMINLINFRILIIND